MSKEQLAAEAVHWESVVDDGDQSDDWPYCECGNGTTIEEEDTNQCDCCGKALW